MPTQKVPPFPRDVARGGEQGLGFFRDVGQNRLERRLSGGDVFLFLSRWVGVFAFVVIFFLLIYIFFSLLFSLD